MATTPLNPRPTLAPRLADERRDAFLRDAFRELVQDLDRVPEPAHLFHDALSAKGRIYWTQLLRAHDAAIGAGQSLAHCLAFAQALAAYVRLRVAERDGTPVTSLQAALRDSAYVDAASDVARVELLVGHDTTALRDFVTAGHREIAVLQELVRLAEVQLARQEIGRGGLRRVG